MTVQWSSLILRRFRMVLNLIQFYYTSRFEIIIESEHLRNVWDRKIFGESTWWCSVIRNSSKFKNDFLVIQQQCIQQPIGAIKIASSSGWVIYMPINWFLFHRFHLLLMMMKGTYGTVIEEAPQKVSFIDDDNWWWSKAFCLLIFFLRDLWCGLGISFINWLMLQMGHVQELLRLVDGNQRRLNQNFHFNN